MDQQDFDIRSELADIIDHIDDLDIREGVRKFYKEYVKYTCSARGIPFRRDALTNVQRIILLNAPSEYTSTNSVIGDCIKAGYRHGDASLAGAIAKLVRKFDNSYSPLKGSGYFGNNMNPTPGAPRYTKCKIDPKISKMIKKYQPVNEFDIDGQCKHLNLDVPLGLCTFIIGISPGYRCQIFPRKMEDMLEYLNGENKMLKPHFQEFKGHIKRGKKDNSWLVSSDVERDGRTIRILDMPVLMKYETFLKRIEKVIEQSDSHISIFNDSKTFVDIKLKIKKDYGDIDEIMTKLEKAVSMDIPEDIVFVDESGAIVRYDSIKDYLDDFKVFRNNSELKKMKHDQLELRFEKQFNKIKQDFMKFLMEGDKNKTQVNKFIKNRCEDVDKMERRLKDIPAYSLTTTEIEEVRKKIIELERDIQGLAAHIKEFQEKQTLTLQEDRTVSY